MLTHINIFPFFPLFLFLLYHLFLIKRDTRGAERRLAQTVLYRASASANSPLRVSVKGKLGLGGLDGRHLTEVDSVGRLPRREMIVNILARGDPVAIESREYRPNTDKKGGKNEGRNSVPGAMSEVGTGGGYWLEGLVNLGSARSPGDNTWRKAFAVSSSYLTKKGEEAQFFFNYRGYNSTRVRIWCTI